MSGWEVLAGFFLGALWGVPAALYLHHHTKGNRS